MEKSVLNIDSNNFQESRKQIFLNETSANNRIRQTDEELWNAFKEGSLTAFKLIYERNIDILLNYGNKIAPYRDVAADCIQDLFVDLWNRRSKLGKVKHIKGYLFISYRRRLMNFLKRQNNIRHIEYLDGFEIILTEPISDWDMAENKKASIVLALNALSYQMKEAIYLRFFNDLSCAEIGEIMIIKTQSVYNLISSGLKIIKKSDIILPQNCH